MAKKKYGLHCFECGWLFPSKVDVKRINGLPYCDVCQGEYLQNEAMLEVYDYEMKKWQTEHPNQDFDQWQIDQANIARYGEC